MLIPVSKYLSRRLGLVPATQTAAADRVNFHFLFLFPSTLTYKLLTFADGNVLIVVDKHLAFLIYIKLRNLLTAQGPDKVTFVKE